MKTHHILTVVGLALAAPFASAQNAVSPNSRATTEGNDSNAYPFCAPNVDRYQQVFGAGSLTAIANKQITHLSFRLDGPSSQSYTAHFQYSNLTIKLSTSTHTPDQLVTTLDMNVGSNVQTVYNGPFTVPTLSNAGGPHPFDLVIPLQHPFTYTSGPLLLEISGPIGPGPSSTQFFLDAEQTTGDSVSRAYSTTAEAVFTDTRGLICRFTAANACYANCDSSTQAPTLNVNDFICFQTRFTLGDIWANCDSSTQAPILNVNDFICFQTRFTLGCP